MPFKPSRTGSGHALAPDRPPMGEALWKGVNLLADTLNGKIRLDAELAKVRGEYQDALRALEQANRDLEQANRDLEHANQAKKPFPRQNLP
ncbi:MAG: hypothetical protein R3F36_14255 [Candidatus Competibacteraceae bacterium]